MKRLILLAGIPGSGKTTLAQSLIAQGYLCLCADQIRRELWGDEAEQKDPEKVFAIFFERLEQALKKNLDIVIDNTNINRRHREPILSRAKNAGYTDIKIWLLETPLELCLERNKNRSRIVPEEILRNMHKTINGPGKPGDDEAAISIIDYSASKD